MTFDIDTFESQSMTATVCENAQLFGATPERGEFDPRDIFDRDEAVGAVGEAFRILAESVAPDGFQLADEREHLLWGIVNAFDAQHPSCPPPRPLRRPAHPRAPRPASRPGRHRGKVAASSS